MDSRDTAAIEKVLEFWEALVRFDGLDDSPATELSRIDAAISFVNGNRQAFEHVAALVVQRIPTIGPGIQLLPFLSGSKALIFFAEEVLTHVWPLAQVGTGDTRLSRLSYGEVCVLLKMSPYKLAQLIESSQLNWPLNKGRRLKIETTESELRKLGFSESEILYATAEESFETPRRRSTQFPKAPKN